MEDSTTSIAGAEPTTPPVITPIGLSAELKEVLAFNEKENQKHREFFQMLYTRTAGALTIIVVVLGALVAFVGWHTLSDIQKQAHAATEEEIQNIRQQSRETLEHQTKDIQQQIAIRLNDEFKTEAIRRTVESAAREQTNGALLPIITNQVKSQVTAGVRSEQQNVQHTLLEAVHHSIEDLKPTIDGKVNQTVSQSVDIAVKSQVDSQITPRLRELENSAQVSTLINEAESGDGHSFDILALMSGSPQVPQDVRALALKVARSIVASHNSGFYTGRQFKGSIPEEQQITFLTDKDTFSREAAVDSLSLAYWKVHLDQLFSIMTSDADLAVRTAACHRFQELTKFQGDALDNYTAKQWWGEHRKEFVN